MTKHTYSSEILLVESWPLHRDLDIIAYLCLTRKPIQRRWQSFLDMSIGSPCEFAKETSKIVGVGVQRVFVAVVIEWDLCFLLAANPIRQRFRFYLEPERILVLASW